MDGIREVLSVAREAGLAAGNFRGLLHIAIGRKIVRGNGTVVSTGVTWRGSPPNSNTSASTRNSSANSVPTRMRLGAAGSRTVLVLGDRPGEGRFPGGRRGGGQTGAVLRSLGYHVGPPPRWRSADSAGDAANAAAERSRSPPSRRRKNTSDPLCVERPPKRPRGTPPPRGR